MTEPMTDADVVTILDALATERVGIVMPNDPPIFCVRLTAPETVGAVNAAGYGETWQAALVAAYNDLCLKREAIKRVNDHANRA